MSSTARLERKRRKAMSRNNGRMPATIVDAMASDEALPLDPIAKEYWTKDLQNPLRRIVLPTLKVLLTITLHKHGISLWDSTTGGGAPIGKRFMQNWRRPYVDCVIGKTASGKKKFMCPGDPPPETAPRGAAVYAPFSAVAREGAESRLLPILAPTAHPTKD